MNNDRELIHAAMQWHAAHARRMAIGTIRRRLDKEIKVRAHTLFSPLRHQQAEAARQLTELKRRELAALRLLAKACAKQRGQFDAADIVDLDIEAKLLTCAE